MVETNRSIRAKYAALTILSGRTLPTLQSDLKVAALIKRYYRDAYEVTEAAITKLRAALPEGWTLPTLPPDLDARWRTEVLDATQTLPDIPPTLRLDPNDLPIALKSNDANRQGVADLIVALGDLFVDNPVETD